jgi:hypothetical protein
MICEQNGEVPNFNLAHAMVQTPESRPIQVPEWMSCRQRLFIEDIQYGLSKVTLVQGGRK